MLSCWFEAAASQMRNSDSAESQPWLGPQLTVKAAPLTVFLKAHESVLLGTAASVATPTAPDMDKTELVVPEGGQPEAGFKSGLRPSLVTVLPLG